MGKIKNDLIEYANYKGFEGDDFDEFMQSVREEEFYQWVEQMENDKEYQKELEQKYNNESQSEMTFEEEIREGMKLTLIEKKEVGEARGFEWLKVLVKNYAGEIITVDFCKRANATTWYMQPSFHSFSKMELEDLLSLVK